MGVVFSERTQTVCAVLWVFLMFFFATLSQAGTPWVRDIGVFGFKIWIYAMAVMLFVAWVFLDE